MHRLPGGPLIALRISTVRREGVEGESHAALFWSCSRIALCLIARCGSRRIAQGARTAHSPRKNVSAPSSAVRRRAIPTLPVSRDAPCRQFVGPFWR